MHSDEDSQTTLSKWPFVLGDVLLVATALAIAILKDWQIFGWEIAFCVVAVALGASLFVLPYVVEFQVRVREEREDRGAELRILHKHVVSGREEVEAAVERLEALEAAFRGLDRSAPDLSAPLAALEKKIDPVAGKQSELEVKLAALGKHLDTLSGQLGEQPDPKALEAMQAELTSLKAELPQLRSELQASIESAKKKEPEAPVAPQVTLQPKTILKKPIKRPTRSSRERKEPEARLLKRAIDQKQDKSSAAVSRIIESRQKEGAKEKDADKSEPQAEVEKEQPEPGGPEVKPPAEVNEAAEVKSEAKPEPKKKAESKPVKKVVAVPKKEAAEPKEEVNHPPEEDPKSETEEVTSTEEAPQEDMFAEAVPAQVKKRVRTKKSDTAVIASVFIGIGNKPYVRGDGAGLSWDSGLEMEFEEIGRWRWIAPSDLEGPIQIQLYRNDEDPDTTGKYTLEPGQQLDLSPVF